MALEIRSIPVLTGETAERFVREAEENERNPQRKALRMSYADVEKVLVRSTANLKAHGGKSPFAKYLLYSSIDAMNLSKLSTRTTPAS